MVGLTIIHIFGFDDPKALELAEKCGIAFQLTNILRDVREDAEKDRVYIPLEDLLRFDVSDSSSCSARAVGEFRGADGVRSGSRPRCIIASPLRW